MVFLRIINQRPDPVYALQGLAMRAGLNYKRMTAIAVPLFGGTRIPGSPHSVATIYQSTNRLSNPTFNQILTQAYKALLVAGCRKKDATELVNMAKNAVIIENKGIVLQ